MLAQHLAIDPEILGLTSDSRRVKPGDLFAALPGDRQDGRNFIDEALAKGAVAVLAPHGTVLEHRHALLLTDDNPRRRFALMAALFYGRQPHTMVAVTGTNGKTSVVNFARQIWVQLGLRAACLGTLGLVAPDRVEPGRLTTPDPANLHHTLADLDSEGVSHAAIEASSHGLAQHRLDGVALSAAAFTNLTRDHLDYHGDMATYWHAKSRLFTELLPRWGTAVINADTAEAAPLTELCRQRGQQVITYGHQGADLSITKLAPNSQGQSLQLCVMGQPYQLTLPLVGAFQAENALCALGLAIATGADSARATMALAQLEGVPGRLQWVANTRSGAAIYVDYAHTPDALETALAALRPHTSGLLWVVFGCGGDRDPGKRPLMGAIAARAADRVIVTDDNPRGESAAAIRAQILATCGGAVEIGDRRAAIAAALDGARSGDVVVLAGKGHERGQIVGDQVLPFDDAEEARLAAATAP
jgi:UDP-N-acetylmuramoyl-L-alanyl-D-glutamate--2,6-diaminopimelate ligase